MDCSPDALMEASRCFRCIPAGALSSVSSYLLCEWSNKQTCDADALTFLTAAGVSPTSTEGAAVCKLVADLKANGSPTTFWDREDVIYPFVGGTSASCSLNLKNPATNTLAYTGGLTFSNLGMKSDGTGYADTGYQFTVQNRGRAFVYIDLLNTGGTLGCYWGSRNGAQTSLAYFQYRNGAAANGNMNGSAVATGVFESLGANFLQRRQAAQYEVATGAANYSTVVTASVIVTAANVYLFALNTAGVAGFIGNGRISGFSAGNTIIGDTERASYKLIWDTFQTALGRGH